MAEPVDLVDKNDKVIGTTTKEHAHQTGEIHRAVHVFVFNSEGKIFLQLRAKDKFLFPGVWDSSVGEHIKKSEEYETAAIRGLQEELGIKKIKLFFVGKEEIDYEDEKVHNHEFVALYSCVFDGAIKIEKEELDDGNFFSIEEAKKMIVEKKTAPFFDRLFALYLSKRGKKCQ
jgi:isopentenyl-diphosphate delta-isomerase type 1